MFQIPNLKTSELSATRSENESRDLVAALVGALVPIIVDEIVKATRSRTVIGSSARAVSVDQISATRGDGQEQRAVRGLFSGSVSAPGVKIGVVIG
jgi:hypothetical protein